jgi:SAM-dependent methyltransferase
MKYIDYCVCCDSKNIRFLESTMYAFVIDRMTGASKQTDKPLLDPSCKMIHCNDCNFVSSNIRFTEEEEARYYKGYGERPYLDHRIQYEGNPMIASMFAMCSDPQYVDRRKKYMVELMKTHLDLSKINYVLDFGGGTGLLIPDELVRPQGEGNRYVLDFSDNPPVNGIVPVKNKNECAPVDLLICAHTLEHVSYPSNFIKMMKEYIKPNGFIYLEVPNERKDNPIPKVGNDFHEHINMFNIDSLRKVMELNDIEVFDIKEVFPQFQVSAIAAIGRLK